KPVEYVLTTLGLLANQGGPLQWVAIHRMHHKHSDAPGDPHSPRDGVWWAHLLWWMPYAAALDDPARYERYVADLAKDPVHRLFQRCHVLVPLALAGFVFALGQACGACGPPRLGAGACVR